MHYDFDRAIDRLGTDSVKWGVYPSDVLPLFVADMDFLTPPPVVRALAERAEKGVFGYTRPGEELIDTVLSWFKKEYGYELKPGWITWVPGIVPALNAACTMTEGEVLTNVPNYSGLLSAPVKARRERVDSPMLLRHGRYEIDYEDLQRRVTPSTGIFLLCSPHNPVGRVYTREELVRLAEFAGRNRLLLISDEIHCELVLEGRHIPFVTLDKELVQNSITFMSPAKTCNIPGISAAFGIVPNPELKKRFEAAAFALPQPNALSYAATRAAYGECDDWKRELVEYLRENRDYLESELKRRFPGVLFTRVEATYLLWLDFSPLGIRSPFRFFYEKARIAFTDGKDFGADGFVRLNFGCPRSILKDALDRMEKALFNRVPGSN